MTGGMETRFSIGNALTVAALMLALNCPIFISLQCPTLHMVHGVLKVLAMCYLSYRLAVDFRIDAFLMGALSLFAWSLIDCLLIHAGSDVSAIVLQPMTCLFAAVMVSIFARNRRDELVVGCFFAYLIWVGVNILTQIYAPEGLFFHEGSMGVDVPAWFLGQKNIIYGYCVVFTGLSLLLPIRGRFVQIALRLMAFTIFAVTAFMADSSTGIICCLLFGLSILIRSFGFSSPGVKTLVLGYVGAFFFLMLVKNSDCVADFAELFGKSVTFSGRTNIWEVCWEMVAEHPIVGYGWLDPIFRTQLVDDAVGAVNAHNTILELLFTYGGVGLALWMVFVGLALSRLAMTVDERRANFLRITVCCLFLATLMEAMIFNIHVFIVLSLCYYLSGQEGACATV